MTTLDRLRIPKLKPPVSTNLQQGVYKGGGLVILFRWESLEVTISS